MSAEVPAGFEPSERTGPFFDLIGPVYAKTRECGILLGLRARAEHCNARGFVHGAVLAALLDVVCGRNCSARTVEPEPAHREPDRGLRCCGAGRRLA